MEESSRFTTIINLPWNLKNKSHSTLIATLFLMKEVILLPLSSKLVLIKSVILNYVFILKERISRMLIC